MNPFGCWEPFWKLRQEPYAGRDGTCLRWAYDERIERNNRIEQADDRLYPHSCASGRATSQNRAIASRIRPHPRPLRGRGRHRPPHGPPAERAVHPPLHPADGRSRKDRRLRAGTDERQYRRGIARHVAHACGAVHGRADRRYCSAAAHRRASGGHWRFAARHRHVFPAQAGRFRRRTAQIRRSALCSARAQRLRILAERGR